ncbi:endogenous retrovirus group K member 6 Env polyprotein [Bubalus bubalis]|uniref:endogenous retrovirus group K member 6 Env polyprotein n=1 Tax=Bubalus bubalis TaxID=89462 RepID=UPI001D10AA0C|nr:endogenous retrovirus group K member 6 Env polyprotein [Bubalus bubalis]
MSQPPRHLVPPLPRPQKRKGPPLPPRPPPTREAQLISRRMTPEIPDEQEEEPPTRQMSQLRIRDIVPPNSLPHRKSPGCPTRATQQASIPTWGQIKTLCHQAQGIASPQGSPASPERVFIAMLALLSCQVSASSPAPEKYWAYFPDPPTFQVVTWNNAPIRVHTNQPHLLGGHYTFYTNEEYPINFNYTFRGLTDDLPVCFNFPFGHTGSFITPTKEGCIGASEKAIITDSPSLRYRSVWVLLARMPGIPDPSKSLHFKSPPKYPNCHNAAPSDAIWNTIDGHSGYPIWKSCTYNSRIDYRIPGGNYTIQDWSNPDPGQDPMIDDAFKGRFDNWKDYSVPWPLRATRWHRNQFVPPMLSYTAKGRTYWQPEIWKALTATAPITLTRPENTSTYSVLACLPSPYVFLFTNDSKRLNIHMNYSGGPNIVTCEQCMLSSCLTPQYNVSSFVVLQRPPYLMVPVTITTHWYDNYGLAVLQQVRDLMRSRRLAGLLFLGVATLITGIASVSMAAVSLTKQVHTAQYVDAMSKNVSLALATEEAIFRKLEMRIDALEEAILHIGNELQALKVRLALSCHADYRWICVTPLKVNETDYDWQKIKNHILGVWNSSDISLDLRKLHSQMTTIERSHLDFTASGVASDFFHTLSNFVSGKYFLSAIFNYAAVAALILLIIFILPCIVRILRQSIQKLETELHLASLRNKNGGDAGSQHGSSHP